VARQALVFDAHQNSVIARLQINGRAAKAALTVVGQGVGAALALECSVDRIKRLDEVGFIWDLNVWLWEEGFNALVMFKAREGHCRVVINHLEDSFKLGQWVRTQRVKKNDLSPPQLSRLDELGFVWSLR